MKRPSVKGWIAILVAILGAIAAIVIALEDRHLTRDEVQEIGDKISDVVETIETETADD